MNPITFECEVITPTFLSGADRNSAEFRAPSIKGAMRFWWRAVKGLENIEELRREEAKIFGGGGDNANKSSFSIKISHDSNIRCIKERFPNRPIKVVIKGTPRNINILEYLAYGTYDYVKGKGNVFNREYFPPETKLSLFILIRNEKFIKDILLSFYFLCAFGGLGSRSRNGFGSFNILNREAFIELGKEYVDNIVPTKEMLKPFMISNYLPNFSAFSDRIKLFKSNKNFDSWDGCLADIGEIYKESRERLENHYKYDRRQYIGSPIVVDRKYVSFLERHSKPYFLKVVKEKENQYRGYILYLASKYCEGLDKDREEKKINHLAVNDEFNNVCSRFNKLLESKLEVIL